MYFCHFPVVTGYLNVRTFVPADRESPGILHYAIFCPFFVRFQVFAVHFAVDFLRVDYVREGRNFVHLSGVEHCLSAVKQVVEHVYPSFRLASLYFRLADRQSWASTYFLKVFLVACQEIDIKLLENLSGLHFKLFKAKVGVVGFHGFDGSGARTLRVGQVSSLDSSLHCGVLCVFDAFLQVGLKLLVICSGFPQLLVFFAFFELLRRFSRAYFLFY